MQIILSKQEVLASNEIIHALIDDLDIIDSSDKRMMNREIQAAKEDFKGWVTKFNDLIIEKNDGQKIKVEWNQTDDGVESIKISFNERYTMSLLNVYIRHADTIGTLINCVAGLMIGLKSAFKSLSKLFDKVGTELNDVEKEFSDKARTAKETQNTWGNV